MKRRPLVTAREAGLAFAVGFVTSLVLAELAVWVLS